MEVLDTVVIGAGIAGLSAAHQLIKGGFKTCILEANAEPGGRVRTLVDNGYRMDLGFQVFLTAYPEAIRQLDYSKLDFCAFQSGAMVRHGNGFTRISDPFRDPTALVSTLMSDVAPLGDKIKIAYLRQKLMNTSVDEIFRRPEKSIHDALLNDYGFSPKIIDRFFRPFFGGITLDASLSGSARMFDFVFKMMSEGNVAIPRLGMGEISKQLAAKLPAETIRFNSRVSNIEPDRTSFEGQNVLTVVMADNSKILARSVVIATEGTEAGRLCPSIEKPKTRTVNCLYFSHDIVPSTEPLLFLNGNLESENSGGGVVNNLAILTNCSPALAPRDKHLYSVTVLEEGESPESLEKGVRKQLISWFGQEYDKLEHLKTMKIERALPDQSPPWLDMPRKAIKIDDAGRTLYVCGDHRDNASINGAMVSGRRAAEQILKDLKVTVSLA